MCNNVSFFSAFHYFCNVLSSTFTAITFALANYGVSLLGDRGGAAARERKKFDLAIETSQKARDKWNQERIETLDFINKEMRKSK